MLPLFFGESEAVSIVLSWRDVLSAPTATGASSLPARSPVPFVERFSHRCSRFSAASRNNVQQSSQTWLMQAAHSWQIEQRLFIWPPAPVLESPTVRRLA
jgi:hypothetical protein